jgi:hypothetical protein
MAPSTTEAVAQVQESVKETVTSSASGKSSGNKTITTGLDEMPELLTGHREPLRLSGALEQFKQFDLTPIIGKEFVDVDLSEWIQAPNSDELLRDLAITSKHQPLGT